MEPHLVLPGSLLKYPYDKNIRRPEHLPEDAILTSDNE